MSRIIALSQIKIRNVHTFELAFEKYSEELRRQSITQIPVFTRELKPTYSAGQITIQARTVASLHLKETIKGKKPRVTESGEIVDGYAELSGDEDYLSGKRTGVKNDIQYDRLDTYYGAEAAKKTMQRLGFDVTDYTVDENCGTDFFCTKEVEGELVNSF